MVVVFVRGPQQMSDVLSRAEAPELLLLPEYGPGGVNIPNKGRRKYSAADEVASVNIRVVMRSRFELAVCKTSTSTARDIGHLQVWS